MATIAQIVAQIRTAIYGKDVRENIAQGIEKCYSDVTAAETLADAAATRANEAAARGETINSELGDNADDLVIVSQTQPSLSKEFNKVWVKPDGTEYQVPTWEEFSDLKSALDTEITNRTNGDTALLAEIELEGQRLTQKDTEIETALNSEIARATSEEERIEALFTGVATETIIEWLDNHPEATTTVQDGSITFKKLSKTVADVFFMPVAYYESTDASGESTVLRSNKSGKIIMIDSGATHSYVLIKTKLIEEGISHIDYFILTHYHADHYGNIESLIEDGFIDSETIAYLPKLKTAGVTIPSWGDEDSVNTLLNMCEIIRPDEDTTLTVDDIHINFFNCSDDDIAYYDSTTDLDGYPNTNNYSVCNLITIFNTRILMTGDLQEKGQKRVCEEGYISHCDVLKVPHHAYDVNYYEGFFYACSPAYAVTFTNRWLYQHNESPLYSKSLVTLHAIGTNTHTTGDGALVVGIDYSNFTVYGNGMNLQPNETNLAKLYIYVDTGYEGTECDGSIEKPYKTINQAISAAKDSGVFYVRIFPANVYSSSEDVVIPSATPVIEIQNVTVKSISIYNSTAVLTNVTLTKDDSGPALYCENAKIYATGLTCTGNTTSLGFNGRALRFYNTTGFITTSTISNKYLAVSAYWGSRISLHNISGTGNTNIILANNSDIITMGLNFPGQKIIYNSNSSQTMENMTMVRGQYGTNSADIRRELESGEDLDNIIIPGIYTISSGATLSTLLHIPDDIVAGAAKLTVEWDNANNNQNAIRQVIENVNSYDNKIFGLTLKKFERIYYVNRGFSDWVRCSPPVASVESYDGAISTSRTVDLSADNYKRKILLLFVETGGFYIINRWTTSATVTEIKAPTVGTINVSASGTMITITSNQSTIKYNLLVLP